MNFGRRWDNGTGGSGGFRGRRHTAGGHHVEQVWRPRMDNKRGEVKDSFQVGAGDSFQFGERLEQVQSSVDPMEE
jgi:hypothetical protein